MEYEPMIDEMNFPDEEFLKSHELTLAFLEKKGIRVRSAKSDEFIAS